MVLHIGALRVASLTETGFCSLWCLSILFFIDSKIKFVYIVNLAIKDKESLYTEIFYISRGLVRLREDWMLYGGPGFLVVVWSTSPPPPPPRGDPPVSLRKVSFPVFVCVADRAYWPEREGGGGWGAKSYDREKTCSSINHSIFFGLEDNKVFVSRLQAEILLKVVV